MDFLRKKLGELEQQKKLCFDEIQQLRTEFPHSIQLVDQSPTEAIAHLYVNCVMYAFNLQCDDLYRAIAGNVGIHRKTFSRSLVPDKRISADTEFVDYCIDEGLIPSISDRDLEFGDLVVYSDSERCRHVGKLLEQDRICSKWGLTELLEHELFEVPDFYGENVLYFESLRFEQSQDRFIEYARSVVEDNPRTKLLLDITIKKYR